VIDTSTEPPSLRCTRCTASWPIPLPMRIDALVAYSNAFTTQHHYCKPKESPDVTETRPTKDRP
jgi:hypothetical protein